MIYLDTSLLLKRYCQEAGSDDIRKLLSNIKGIATSELAYVEFFSALSRKRREGRLSVRTIGKWRLNSRPNGITCPQFAFLQY